MDTPILDFLKQYSQQDRVRFHMPGHKGRGILGCEKWDITEVYGGDALYEADGIIAESERNAAELFGTRRTCYSTEGSSQCIRAMLYLALNNRPKGNSNVIVAARNVHKAFVYAAALLDIEPVWLWPESGGSLCGCPVTPKMLKETLDGLDAPPAAVYVTSPDYLGGMADIESLADVCHDSGTMLIVDNAHGAYLKFLPSSLDPLDLGADMCCASAHKTLPVLTGGAYLHISRRLPECYAEQAKAALALFGSTSPSYLILASLDACNSLLAGDYPKRIAEWAGSMERLKRRLKSRGWEISQSDPLRLTIRAARTMSGKDIAMLLRGGGIECEYADAGYAVLMTTPNNTLEELHRLENVLGECSGGPAENEPLPLAGAERAMSVREAFFRPHELIPVREALGRICGAPAVSCPPAIPIAVSGERIGREAVELFEYYSIDKADVIK